MQAYTQASLGTLLQLEYDSEKTNDSELCDSSGRGVAIGSSPTTRRSWWRWWSWRRFHVRYTQHRHDARDQECGRTGIDGGRSHGGVCRSWRRCRRSAWRRPSRWRSAPCWWRSTRRCGSWWRPRRLRPGDDLRRLGCECRRRGHGGRVRRASASRRRSSGRRTWRRTSRAVRPEPVGGLTLQWVRPLFIGRRFSCQLSIPQLQHPQSSART